MKPLILILCLFISGSVWAKTTKNMPVAINWLQLIDAGKYTKSWQQADALFKSQLSKANWKSALSTVRAPLGKVATREQISANEYTSLPGAPQGKYLIVQFKTQFSARLAVETLTLSKSSGQWRAVGYFIK
ncbi:DUF4019 domain-containing protein [Pseudoalteromonas sp. C12FD-1]|nr:hypothetical protein PspMM1_33950 [Pseudoalteromonas sp. MM1]